MDSYCVNRNAQSNGDHEVHNVTKNCAYLPDWSNRQDLGLHQNCTTAVQKAKQYFARSNGCYHCATACHTT
ncbi:MAG: hypothetical protein R2707_16535 [Acidimicrobiales bacterium]